MAIAEKDFEIEKEHFEETKSWIGNQINSNKQNDDQLKEKIAVLRKASKGRYSEELETNERLYEIVHKNLKKYYEALNQPYFGRIDFRERKRYDPETFYIGKFGLGDLEEGEEKVIDWRAPIADLYYSGTSGKCYYVSPMGVIDGELTLKRKFLLKDYQIADAFDEGINEIIIRSSGENGRALMDEYLRINLENSVSSKLKDVVATIQKEQNEIIRADKNFPLIVQGSAGSGKTTVALHRLAYLLYKYKDSIKGEDILVIAPNKVFLDYISEVLPDLGVESVKQKTFEEIALNILNIKGKVYTKDKKLSVILEEELGDELKFITNSSKVKGTHIFKQMMDRYVTYLQKQDSNIEDIKVMDYILFEKTEIKRLFIKDMSRLPINKRKEEIKKYFSKKLNEKITSIFDKIDFTYEYFVSRAKKEMEDSKERREKLIRLYDERDSKKVEIKEKAKICFDEYFVNWKGRDILDIYKNLFNNDEIWNEITLNKIPEALSDYMKNEFSNNLKEGIIDSDDLAAMLYLKFKIEGVQEEYKFKHIVVDEAQDYSMFQIEALKDMASNNSFTIVGDVGQGIYYYKGINNWNDILKEVFEEKASYIQLTQSYRSTVEIINFANKVLTLQKDNIEPATPVLRHGNEPEVIEFDTNKQFAEKVDEIVEDVKAIGKNSVAIIGRTYKECKKIRDFMKKYSKEEWEIIKDTDKTINLERIIIPSYMTKGLEFDCSIVFNCNEKNYGENELDKKILYVVLTRALHREYIFFNGEMSPLIKTE